MTQFTQLKDKVIYFDNAATTFPKPETVVTAVTDFMTKIGANPGRSAHKLSVDAGQIVFETRMKIADGFGCKNPMYAVMTSNGTDALNLAIRGLVEGIHFEDEEFHVITTSIEHNSTIRPLKALEAEGKITLTIVGADKNSLINPIDIQSAIKPETRLVVLNHASNVTGVVQPAEEVGEICTENGIFYIIDASQTAGIVDVKLDKMKADMIAFAGHKGLYGPTGTGVLLISPAFDINFLKPIKCGGTGSLSEKIVQPDFMPDKYESGTLNMAGIAGLSRGIDFIKSLGGVDTVYEHKQKLIKHFIEKATAEIPNFISYSDVSLKNTGTIAFNLKGVSPSDVSQKLSEKYNIMCRPGLHCSPLTHETIGTFETGGTLRFGFSYFNTLEEINVSIAALKEIGESNGE